MSKVSLISRAIMRRSANARMYHLLNKAVKSNRAATRLEGLFELGVHPKSGTPFSPVVRRKIRKLNRRMLIRAGAASRASDRMSAVSLGDSPFSTGQSGSRGRLGMLVHQIGWRNR